MRKLRNAIAPLTDEQLNLQPAPHMWPVSQLVQHLISVRAGWFSGIAARKRRPDEPVHGVGPARITTPQRRRNGTLPSTKRGPSSKACLLRWTPADCAQTFPDEWDGESLPGVAQLGHLPRARTRSAPRRRNLGDPRHAWSSRPESLNGAQQMPDLRDELVRAVSRLARCNRGLCTKKRSCFVCSTTTKK
jgi:hypothetical protein